MDVAWNNTGHAWTSRTPLRSRAVVFNGQAVNAAPRGLEACAVNRRTPVTQICLEPLQPKVIKYARLDFFQKAVPLKKQGQRKALGNLRAAVTHPRERAQVLGALLGRAGCERGRFLAIGPAGLRAEELT
eukprot:8054371-Pyramimonas_sp.AAC.1